MSKQTATARKSAPVTAHRLFPAIVALWFAALLGIGSFVVPPSLFEGPVVAIGLPKVLPAATPPLGFTARALLSLLMTGIGAAFGIALGLKLSRRPAPAAERRTGPKKQPAPVKAVEAEPRQPLFASEVFAGIDPWNEAQPAEAVEAEAWTADAADYGLASADPEEAEFVAAEETGEVAAFAHHEPLTLSEPAPEFEPAPEPEPAPAAVFAPPAEAAPEPAPADPIERLRRGAALDPDALRAARLDTLGTVQLVERLAMAMAEWRAPEPAPVPAPALAVVAPAAIEVPEAEAEPASAPVSTWTTPAVTEAPAPVEPSWGDEASPVVASEAPAEAVPANDPPVDEPATPFAAATCEPDGEPAAIRRPSILAPLDLRADDDHAAADVAPPRFLTGRPLDAARDADEAEPTAAAGPFSAPSPTPLFRSDPVEEGAPAAARPSDDDAEEGEDGDEAAAAPPAGEDRFPSLLDMAPRAPRSEPIRLSASDGAAGETQADDEAAPYAMPFAPPASGLQTRRPTIGRFAATPTLPVTAPEVPADPVDAEEADRALRAALATLQRMSGGR